MKSFPSPTVLGSAVVGHLLPLIDYSEHAFTPISDAHGLLSGALEGVPRLRGMSLYTFGSACVTGVREQNSDIDFVLLDKRDVNDGRGIDSVAQKAKAIQSFALAQLAKALRSRNPTWKVEEVKRTRVPLLRVVASESLQFDVSANRRNGVRNSALLRAYLSQHFVGRWLSLSVKHWSKRAGINGTLGFLNSYAFNILVAYYMMQRKLATFVPLESTDVARCPQLPLRMPLVQIDAALLGETIQDFFQYYMSEFDVENNVVTLSREGSTSKEQLNWTKAAEGMLRVNQEKISYRFCIEDPYEINLNVGRYVTPFKLEMLQKHFENAMKTGLGLVLPD